VTPRLLRLRPWLIRALIPPRKIGAYVLYTAKGSPYYIGRSDTDIQRRLLRHCTDRCGDYFTYDVYTTPAKAFDMECALFHLLAPRLSNRIHPDRPDFHQTPCAFCRHNQRATRQMRARAQTRHHPVRLPAADESKDRQ
jgi:hypothetical protein